MIEKNIKETFVKFTKEAYKMDSMDILLYGVLKTFENKAGFTSISVKQLIEFVDVGRSLVNKIEKSLTNLKEQQLITMYDGIDFKNKVKIGELKLSDILYIRIHEMVTDHEPFIQIYTNEIWRFISIKMKGTKADIFKQFMYIMKFVNQSNAYRKISFPNISTISEETGVSDRSVKNYTKTLEEHGFLYSNILVMEKEKVKKIYSRPQYSQDVDDAIAECISNKTKVINNKKNSDRNIDTSSDLGSKEYKGTLKNPESILKLDKQIRSTFHMYEGELNDQSISKLQQLEGEHGVEVLNKALHIAMDRKKGLNNPTGFMLKKLAGGDVIKEAKYQIKRSKEKSERMDREDSKVKSFDYVAALRESKEREKEQVRVSDGGQNEILYNSLIGEISVVETKIEQPNQVETYFYVPDWKRSGFNSREEYEKVKEKEALEKLVDDLQKSYNLSEG